jgi:hypothetical protein
MWRACGMRVALMAGWKQDDGDILTATYVIHLTGWKHTDRATVATSMIR